MMGDTGEPIGVPNFCLYKLLLNEKKVECIISCNANKNLFLGMLHSEEICPS